MSWPASVLKPKDSTGTSLTQGERSLVLTSLSGQRVTVIEGSDNTTVDSVLGWVQAEAAEEE